MLAIIRFAGALGGFFFGFYLGKELLQISDVTPVSNQVTVVLLLGVACGILGWLGAPYITVVPAAAVTRGLREVSAADLLTGTLGGGVGLLLGLLLAFPLALLPGEIGRFGPVIGAAALGLGGAVAGIVKRAELLALARQLAGGGSAAPTDQLLLDTSVIIDGRIADVVRTRFVRGTLLLPRFILAELQTFADSPESSRRERGRRGLEMLARMQKESTVRVQVIDADPAAPDPDSKLVALGRTLGVPVLTNDYGLERVAELQGITVLNVNDLAKALRPVVLPGEQMAVHLMQEGKEPGQGVGYLEDGTMVVVENGSRHIGTDLHVTVMRVLQTVGGRMIFAQPAGEPIETRRARAVGH